MGKTITNGLKKMLADPALKELRGRRGFRDLLFGIENNDPETWQDIRQSVAVAIMDAITKQGLVITRPAPPASEGG